MKITSTPSSPVKGEGIIALHPDALTIKGEGIMLPYPDVSTVKGRAFSYKIPRAGLLEKRPRIFILLMKRPGCHAGCYHLEMVLSNNRAVQDVPAFAEGYERHTSC